MMIAVATLGMLDTGCDSLVLDMSGVVFYLRYIFFNLLIEPPRYFIKD